MSTERCKECGNDQVVPTGSPGFRCSQCQTDYRFVPCRRCGETFWLYGPLVGSGSMTVKCPSCRAKSIISFTQLRAVTAEVRRFERAAKFAERMAAADEKEKKRLHTEA